MPLTCRALPPVRWVPLPPAKLAGRPEKILVYRVSVTENERYIPYLCQLLTQAEQQRARRYHAAADYHRFVVRRAALRLLLGACLSQPPAGLDFISGPGYKPLVATAPHVQFNVSHSGSWVLIVIAPVAVGVDVEQVVAGFPFQEMLAHSFSPPEQAFIGQSTDATAAFFELWTRKEAAVKATAQGIDTDFGQVPVLDGRHHWPALPTGPGAEWVVSSFALAPGYAAALAHPAAVPASEVQFCEIGDLMGWVTR